MKLKSDRVYKFALGLMLIILPALLVVPSTLAKTPPGAPEDGLDEVVDQGWDAGTLYPGSYKVVQEIYIADDDEGTYPVIICNLNIDNLGTATVADILNIEVLAKKESETEFHTVAGPELVSEFPVTLVPFGFEELPDDASATVRIKVSIADSTTESTLQLRTEFDQDE